MLSLHGIAITGEQSDGMNQRAARDQLAPYLRQSRGVSVPSPRIVASVTERKRQVPGQSRRINRSRWSAPPDTATVGKMRVPEALSKGNRAALAAINPSIMADNICSRVKPNVSP